MRIPAHEDGADARLLEHVDVVLRRRGGGPHTHTHTQLAGPIAPSLFYLSPRHRVTKFFDSRNEGFLRVPDDVAKKHTWQKSTRGEKAYVEKKLIQ